ncbi:hypothetical protein GDO81_007671, partial [Engystomops pustulosus]
MEIGGIKTQVIEGTGRHLCEGQRGTKVVHEDHFKKEPQGEDRTDGMDGVRPLPPPHSWKAIHLPSSGGIGRLLGHGPARWPPHVPGHLGSGVRWSQGGLLDNIRMSAISAGEAAIVHFCVIFCSFFYAPVKETITGFLLNTG